jgi:hypothetical protein
VNYHLFEGGPCKDVLQGNGTFSSGCTIMVVWAQRIAELPDDQIFLSE